MIQDVIYFIDGACFCFSWLIGPLLFVKTPRVKVVVVDQYPVHNRVNCERDVIIFIWCWIWYWENDTDGTEINNPLLFYEPFISL